MTSTTRENAAITRPSSTPRSSDRLRLNQPAATPTTANSAPIPSTANTYVRACDRRCRSRPCCAAAKATAAAADSAVAADQTSTPLRPEPVSAETRAPTSAPTAKATATAATRRERSSLGRDTGPSNSQKPSAADASTGPNNRLAASATATAAANAAQGRIVRADRHVGSVHWAMVRWALSTTLMSMAPIINAPIRAM